MLTPSNFTKEAAFIAHVALKSATPFEHGIDNGIRALKYQRKFKSKSIFEFSDERFDKHVEYYLPLVKQMIESYLAYEESDLTDPI